MKNKTNSNINPNQLSLFDEAQLANKTWYELITEEVEDTLIEEQNIIWDWTTNLKEKKPKVKKSNFSSRPDNIINNGKNFITKDGDVKPVLRKNIKRERRDIQSYLDI